MAEAYDLGLCCYCERPASEHRPAHEGDTILHCAPFTDEAPILWLRDTAMRRDAMKRHAFVHSALMLSFRARPALTAAEAGAAHDAWEQEDRDFRARWRYRRG